MIRCLLVDITRNHRGQPIRKERVLTAEEISIGRGADCKIHLSDPRANLHCAVIKRIENGKLFIDGEGTLLGIAGAYEHNAHLSSGMRLHIGPYEFVIEKIDGDDELVLSVELVYPLPVGSEGSRKSEPKSLAETGISKRRLAYWLAGCITLVFLILPLVQSLSHSLPSAITHARFAPTQLWDPGSISPGHISFGAQCAKCHEAPFRPVRDKACLSCHTQPGRHLQKPQLDKHVFREMRCTECHREHQHSKPIAMQGDRACILCHANIKKNLSESDLADIHDFGTDHPAFRLSFKTGVTSSDVRRVVQTDISKVVEDSGLSFSHVQHIGLVEVPWDRAIIKDLKCSDCHQPEEGEMRFRPISMKQHCYFCHQDQLEFKLAPEGRKLPHGSVTELSNTLHDYYAGLAFKHRKSIAWVNEQLDKAIQSMSKGYGCDYCHIVQPSKDGGNLLRITPVNITQRWFPFSIFPHAQHQTFNCAECHKVEQSAQSPDVAIPTIRSCKQCHTGVQPERNKVVSNCTSCHTFHMAP